MGAFYADENVPLPLVAALRALGHDVLTALDDGRAGHGIGDAEVLRRSTDLGRAALTNNRKDFHRLHRRDAAHAGIVTYTNDEARVLAARIDAAVSALPTLAGALVKVVRPNPRPTPAPSVP